MVMVARSVLLFLQKVNMQSKLSLQAGADHVGPEDLIDKISAGWMDFLNMLLQPRCYGCSWSFS